MIHIDSISQSIWQASVIERPSTNVIQATFITLELDIFKPVLRFSYGKKSVVQKLKNVEIIDKIKVVDVDYVQDL